MFSHNFSGLRKSLQRQLERRQDYWVTRRCKHEHDNLIVDWYISAQSLVQPLLASPLHECFKITPLSYYFYFLFSFCLFLRDRTEAAGQSRGLALRSAGARARRPVWRTPGSREVPWREISNQT
jgi:hypothetical protein